MSEEQSSLHTDFHELKEAFLEHTREDREDFLLMRNQMTSMREELSQVQGDVTELKTDVKAMKTDLAEVKTSQGWIIKLGGAILSIALVSLIAFVFAAIRKGAGF